jgi:hypothetical protein
MESRTFWFCFSFGTRKKLSLVTTLNYVTGLKCWQRKDEREKINKKEKEKRKLTLKMVEKERKKNHVRKNFFIRFCGAAVCGSFSFFGRSI